MAKEEDFLDPAAARVATVASSGRSYFGRDNLPGSPVLVNAARE